MVFGRLPDLAYEYIVTTVWSLGICVSAFGLEMPSDKKLRLLSVLNQHIDSAEGIPPTSVSNIPSLAFSLACFFNQEDMNELVTETIEKLSAIYRNYYLKLIYIVDMMIQRMDILNCSSLLMAWGRAYMRNEEMLERVAEEIGNKHKQKLFYEEGALAEIVNIM